MGEKTRRAIWKPVQAAGGADTPPIPPAAAAAGKITAEAPRRENRRGASAVCGKKAGPHAVSNFSFGIWQYFGGLSVTGRPLFSLSKAVS